MLLVRTRGCITAVTILAAASTVEAQTLRLPPGTLLRVSTIPYNLDLPGVRILAQDADTVTMQLAGDGPRTLPRAHRHSGNNVP